MIGLIDVDGKLPNLALMKISSYYKSIGEQVEFVQDGHNYDRIYGSAIFTKSADKCQELIDKYGDAIQIGGTGWDITGTLPTEIDGCRPDYDLYTIDDVLPGIRGVMTRSTRIKKAQQIVDAGIGFTSRGCVRKCPFCFVPKKEPEFKQDTEIADIINPRSNVIILHDNNLTADPLCIDKLHEIRDRGLTVDINQGVDVRLMTDDIARALSEVKHLRSIHYAWDLMPYERQVLDGIDTLTRYIKPYKQMCFVLVGFNTTFEEDEYRVRMLLERGISPYIMRYNERRDDIRLNHFARWVNGRVCKAVPKFEDYDPWIKAQKSGMQMQMEVAK